MMKKVLFLIPSLSAGGAEKVLRNLVNNMDQSKFDITVQTIYEYEPRKYLAEGIHYKAINHSKTRIGKKLFSYYFRLLAEFKLAYSVWVKDDYDIEIAYLECDATKILAGSTNSKAKKYAWVHCDLSMRDTTEKQLIKMRNQYLKYDQVVCVSDDVKKGFHDLIGNDIDSLVLHNVIDEEEIFYKASEYYEGFNGEVKTQLLAVGRLVAQKNFAYLIDSCKKLIDKGYQFHLTILGEGSDRESLEKQIADNHMEDIITLKGFVNNPYPWIKNCDCVVCSSKYEGFSTVVQEAMILGTPVVTTPCTGMTELLGDSEFGLIVEDKEDGLTDGLEKVLSDKASLTYYSDKATERGKEFYKKKLVEEIEFLLQDIEKR